MTDVAETQVDASPPPRSAGRIIVRNTLFGIGGQFALRVANFIFTILVVRTLGDESFGQYSIVLAWAGLFGVIGDLGINQYLAREIARDKNKANELYWDTVVLRAILALIASIITIGGAILFTDYPPEIILGIALFTATYYFAAITAPQQSVLTGNERIDVLAVMTVISQIAYMVLSGLFLFLGFDFVWLVLAGVINMPLVIFLQGAVIRRNKLGPPAFRLNRDLWWSLIRAGMPFAAVQLSLSFAYRVDTIFLSSYVDDATVGLYNAAYRLTMTMLTLSGAFNDAVLPTLAKEHANNPSTVRAWYHTSVRVMLMIALPIAVGGSLLSQQIIGIYGQDFLPASIAFAILIWDIPFVMYHSFCGNIATSIKRESRAARIYVSVGILNVVLNTFLIPQFGIVAACFVTVLTDFFGAALFYSLLRKELGPGLKLRTLLWTGVAAIIMGALVYLLNALGIFTVIVVGIGILCYGILIWLLPAFTNEERHQIREVLRRLAGRVPRLVHSA